MPPLTHRWRAHTSARLGITVEVVDGSDVVEAEVGGLAYLQQTQPVTVAVWSGKPATLAWFPASQARLGPETALTVCGRPGKRQEAAVAEERATGSFRGSDGAIGHIEHHVPAQIHVAVEGTTAAGTPFVAWWIVDPDRRDALRADEAHFFASLRCP